MSLRDVGFRGWALVTATVGTLAIYTILALAGLLFQPPWDLLGVAFGFALPTLALFTIWYLAEVVWLREMRKAREEETQEVQKMGTAEALLRLMDHADRLLDRLTRYTGWFFFLVLLALFLVPFFFSLGLLVWAQGSWLFWVFAGGELAFWAAYFYFYYKIKHENDLWKEWLKRLRERERVLLEG